MSKVSCEAAGKHRRCGFANGASELCDAKESTEGAALRMARVNCDAKESTEGAALRMARENCDAKESTEGAALRMAREKFLKRYLRKTFSCAILTMSTGKK